MRRRALVLLLASAAALAVVGAASAGSGGLVPLSPASPNAEGTRDLYVVALVVAALAFLAVVGALVAFVARPRAQAVGDAPSSSERRTQLLALAGPAFVLGALVALTAVKLPDIVDAPAADAAGETRIVVEAHQFYWLFRYPNDAVSVNEMIAPADTVVHLDVTAPESDVVHSWWVPRLGGKIDAVPGRVNEGWFRTERGTYAARCAELCGLQHAVMRGSVRVVSHERYVDFLNEGHDEATLGRQEFRGVCLVCHELDEPSIGPALAGHAALADRNQLERIVREGVRTMPAVGNTWTDEQIDALYAHTKELEADGDAS